MLLVSLLSFLGGKVNGFRVVCYFSDRVLGYSCEVLIEFLWELRMFSVGFYKILLKRFVNNVKSFFLVY